ncbi:MAG: hypothetical protein VYD19_01185 [Myxococcota bacterium]|nr:hypothetical protein [Myxococcota bacterium]
MRTGQLGCAKIRTMSHHRSKGSVTLITILALFAMIGLGLLALRNTQQGISSAGSARWGKQARQLAEMGVYHAMTLLQQRGDQLFRLRRVGELLELKSNGRIAFLRRNPDQTLVTDREIPVGQFPAFLDGPPLLGELQALTGSYRVVVEHSQYAAPPAGNEVIADSTGSAGPFYCLIHLLGVGYVASAPLPDQLSLESRLAMEHFSESRIHASATLGPFALPCAQ